MLIEPASRELGEYFGEHIRDRLRHNDRVNAESHIDAVKDKGHFKSGQTFDQVVQNASSKKAKLLREWSEQASAIDPTNSPVEAAAWRAVLEGIMSDSDDRLLKVVRLLDASSITFLLEVRSTYSSIPADLRSTGLYETRFNVQAMLLYGLLCAIISLSIAAFSASVIIKQNYVREFFQIAAKEYGISLIVMCIVIFLCAFAPCMLYLSKFRLTSLGYRLRSKIAQYMPNTL